MSKKLHTLSYLGVAFAGLLVSSTPSAMAVNFMWNNTGTTWNGTSSWVGGVAPASSSAASTDTVQFGSMTANFNTVNLSSNRTVLGATFDAGANAYTFTTDAVTPRRLTISTSGIVNNSSAAQTFNLGVDMAQGDSTWQSVAGSSLIFNNGIGLNSGTSTSNRVLTVAGAGNFTVNQAIVNGGQSTAGLVTVTATGTTTFSGNNTYDGRTTMNATGGTLTLSGDNSGAAGGVTLTAGTLNINSGNALGSGALSLAGTGATINNTSGTAVVNLGGQIWELRDGLTFGAAGNNELNNLNLGTGVVTATTSRTVNLVGNNTKLTIGAVNIVNTAGRIITAMGEGNTLEMGGLTLATLATANVTATLAGTANINVTGAIVSGAVAGNGLTVNATGTTTLSGANTYSGLTTMNATGGTLTLSGNNSAASGGVRVTAGTVNVNSANALGTGRLTLDGASSTINNTSGGAVTNAGNNAVLWDGSSSAGFIFGTSASTSASYNLNLGTGTVTAGTSRTMTFAGSGTTLTMGTLDSTSTSGSDLTFTINGAGNTLTLGGYKIRSGNPTTLAAVNDSLAGTANLTINGAIIDGNDYANGLKIKGTGLTTFSGINTYSGVTAIINGATLKLGSSTALGSATGATAVSSGGLLDLNGQTIAETLNYTGTGGLLNSAAGAATVSGVVDIASGMTINTTGDITLSGKLTGSSNKNLTKSGAGTLKFSAGNSDFAGITTVSEGTLLVTSAGNVSSSSSIVNSGGTLRVNGTAGGVTVNAGGILEGSGTVGTTTVAGTLTPGNSPGVLSVNGNLTMASGGNMVWELFANTATQASPAVFDQVLVSGDLVFDGSNGINLNFGTTAAGSTVSWLDPFWSSNQSFLIYDVAGSTTGSSNLSLLNTSFNDATGVALAASQGSFSVSQSGADVLLNYNAIPEPSTGSLLAFGLGGLVLTRLLRRKQI